MIKVTGHFLPLLMSVTDSHCAGLVFHCAFFRNPGCCALFCSMIWIRINDPTSIGLWRRVHSDESTLVKNLSVPLTHHDLIDLGLLILF